jgi:Lipocalin-like domain
MATRWDVSVTTPMATWPGRSCAPAAAKWRLVNGGAQQVRSAYAGYIAYFGTYEVNDAGDTVVHHVQGALNPGWVGGDQVRSMRFDGDLLVLSTDVAKAGAMVKHSLTWKKLA